MTNKKLGNDFEAQFCERLFLYGYWVHNLAQNQSGQPADVIAVGGGHAHLIDCKVCSNNKFPLSRMENNQDLSMEHWKDCGNGDGWFAILLEDQSIYMISHSVIREKAKLRSYLNEKEIREYGTPFSEWVLI